MHRTTTIPSQSASSGSTRPSGEVKFDGPFRTVNELELATLSWVHWFDESRLHSSIGYITPIEKENEYYREINPQSQPALGELAFHKTRGDSLSTGASHQQLTTPATQSDARH